MCLMEGQLEKRRTRLVAMPRHKKQRMSSQEARHVGSQRFLVFWGFVDIICNRILIHWGLIDLFIRSVPLVEVTDASLETSVKSQVQTTASSLSATLDQFTLGGAYTQVRCKSQPSQVRE